MRTLHSSSLTANSVRWSLAGLLTLAAASSASAIACSGKSGAAATSTQTAQSPLSRDLTPVVGPTDVATLVKDNTTFALNLYSGVATDETSNVFYSPYSISLALAMTYEGANGQTAQQMATALSWELPLAQLGPAFDALDLAVEKSANPSAGGSLAIADAIWGDKSLTFKEPFLDALKTDFGVGVNVADFQNEPDVAAAAINGWVASETDQHILNLLPPGVISSDTTAVLVNAVYFTGTWDNPFEPGATISALFTRLDGSTVQANEMQNGLQTGYAEGDGWTAISLPFGENSTSMLVVMPDAGRFATIEKGLSTTFLQGVNAALSPTQVTLSLPKFTVQGATIDLSSQLESLGMTDAFEHGLADFSPMSTPKPDHISKVLHQAFVSVDEAGAEAAGATAVVLVDGGVSIGGAPPVVMNVNRPFLFFLVENTTQTVLFAGRELDPTK